jgi:hypothetical protein
MIKNPRQNILVILIVGTLTAGCADNHYQPIPYDTTTLQASWKQEIALQAEGSSGDDEYVDYLPALEAQIARASDAATPPQIAPGLAAHIGFLYLKRGDSANAKKYFEWEKSKFPESAAAMDSFLTKIKPSGK